MPDICTCGAVLPPDALFCHKCGKPQREDLIAAETVEAPAPPPLPVIVVAAPPPIGFHNGVAVRIALFTGILAFVCATLSGQLSLSPAFSLVWMMAGGFLAAFLYRKRTGQRLSVRSGAHLGWLAGVFVFLIATALFTLTLVVLSEPSLAASVKEQLKSRGLTDANATQFMTLIATPSGATTILLLFFVIFTVPPMFGGAVGAKLFDKE